MSGHAVLDGHGEPSGRGETVLTVTPNPSLDRTFVTGPLVLGEVNRALSEAVEASGKGVNVSRVLHAAGAATLAVLPVGGTEGEHLRKLLDVDLLPYALVPVHAPTRTNTTVAETGGRTTKVNSPGAPLLPAEADALVAMVARQARTAQWAVFSGSLPPGSERDLLPRLIEAARDAGARIAVDTSGEALVVAAECGVDLLAPNAAELAALTGRDLPDSGSDGPGAAGSGADGSGGNGSGAGDSGIGGSRIDGSSIDRSSTDASGRELVEWAACAALEMDRSTGAALLVSLGAAGALWVTGAEALHAVPPRVTPVNTAGAGDALLAGWLYAAGPSEQRLARAVAWGTAACLMPGTSGDVAGRAEPSKVTVRALPVRPAVF
jgi:1-phosphofructokinase